MTTRLATRTVLDAALYVGAGGLASALEALVAPPRRPRSPLAPPAPVIGAVWSGLFALMGAARARLAGHRQAERAIDALWVGATLYPLATRGMRSRTLTYLGNAAVAGLAANAALRASRVDRRAAELLAPVLPWSAYATLILLTEQ